MIVSISFTALGVRVALGAESVKGNGSDGWPRVRAVDAGTLSVDRNEAALVRTNIGMTWEEKMGALND